jgi:hypothetical protein
MLLSARMAIEHELTRSEYRWLAVGAAVIAVLGFARTYYLKFIFHTPILPPLVQIHGAIMTLWWIGFIVQTWLIEARRVRLHQRLGIFMAALAAIVVLFGEILTLNGVAREGRLHQIGKFHYLLGINSVNLSLFAVLVGLGIACRRKPELHKRLMVLAAVTLLAPAVARIVLLFTHKPLPQFIAFYACLLLCVTFDALRHRRLHPVFAVGALAVIAAFQLSYLAVQTSAWMKMVTAHFG